MKPTSAATVSVTPSDPSDGPRRRPGASAASPRARPAIVRPGQPDGRRATNRKERIKVLCDAAVALFLARGIEAVTIDEITKGAGIAKGSFYRYFDDKRDLVHALMQPVHDGARDAFDASMERVRSAPDVLDAYDAYEVLGAGLVELIIAKPELVLLYLQECRAPGEGARGPVRAIADLIAAKGVEHTRIAARLGLLREFKAEVSAHAVIGASEHLIYAVLAGRDVGEPLEIPAQLVSLVLDGIRADRDGLAQGGAAPPAASSTPAAMKTDTETA